MFRPTLTLHIDLIDFKGSYSDVSMKKETMMTTYTETAPVKSTSGAHCKGLNYYVSLICLILN